MLEENKKTKNDSIFSSKMSLVAITAVAFIFEERINSTLSFLQILVYKDMSMHRQE